MKKIIYTTIIIAIQHLIFNTQNSFAQAANDNIGPGNCLSFDGTNDYVDLFTTSSINDIEGLNTGTISFWYKSSNSTNDPEFIFSISDKDARFDYMDARLGESASGLPDESFTFTVRRNHTPSLVMVVQNGTNFYKDRKWHHFAVVTGNGDNGIYIDGEKQVVNFLAGSKTSNEFSNISNPDNMRIGSRNRGSWGVEYVDGEIDELRIWNVARTETQIKDGMCQKMTGSEIGLIGYWGMNNGTGNTIADLTSNGNNGTLH